VCAFSLRREKTAIKILSIILACFWVVGASIFCCALVEKYFFYPVKHYEIIKKYSQEYGVKKELILSVINAESSFNSKAISEKGAKGLMQITDSTAEFIAEKLGIIYYDIFSPETNVNFGTYYLRYLFMRFSNEQTAICAYNAGEGKVRAWLEDNRYSTDGISLKSIPFTETANYLKKITKGQKKYLKYYGYILDKK
jgi:soluble lytic murein transglycosylase